ncbi:unnamed protein product [Polarella glacialis]|uniref:Uncharacterized protein n=1 Tax=Polarella glacialis TaxID=89957 RepID=A0A813LP14_POLGL|nr:unnamed protein product [Polarella glacialis]
MPPAFRNAFRKLEQSWDRSCCRMLHTSTCLTYKYEMTKHKAGSFEHDKSTRTRTTTTILPTTTTTKNTTTKTTTTANKKHNENDDDDDDNDDKDNDDKDDDDNLLLWGRP